MKMQFPSGPHHLDNHSELTPIRDRIKMAFSVHVATLQFDSTSFGLSKVANPGIATQQLIDCLSKLRDPPREQHTFD